MHKGILKAYSVATLAVLINLPLAAQEWAWAKSCGGQGTERGTGVAVDAQGSLYTAGWFESTATFGAQTLTVTGHRDAFIAKWDGNGNLAWAQKGGGKDEDYASAVTVDPFGNPIFMGTFRSATAEFGGLTLTNQYDRDYNSLFVAKLDASGKGLWVQQVGGASTYDSASIQCDALGNVYLVACMARFANFGVTNLTGYEDILVAKYDKDGNLAWARKAGGSGYDYGLGLAATPGGFAYVTGTFEKTAEFNDRTLTSRGLNDLFLAKYTPDGGVEWVTQAGGSSDDANGILAADPEGGVYFGGSFRGSTTVGTNVLTAKASAYDQDVFFARYDGLGNVLWARQVGHALMDPDTPGSVAVKVTTDGTSYQTNVFLSGHFNQFVSVGGVALTNTTAQRMYVSRWTPEGEVLWARHAGGDRSSLACNSDLNPSVYLTGQFVDPSVWDATFLLSSGNADIYHARLDSGMPAHGASSPLVVQSPRDILATIGSSLQLEARVTGSAPLAFRWRRNGANLSDGNRVFGSTTARLSINSAQTNNAGNYTVVVSNGSGAATSAVAVVTIAAATPASGPDWSWVRTIGGTSSDSLAALAVGAAGQAFVAGSFQNTNELGGQTLVAPKNARNIFLAQYTAAGLVQWARQAGGDKTDTPTGTAIDAAGNLYVTGYSSSSNVVFGSHSLANQTPSYTDLFLAKYDSQGSAQWALGGSGTRDDASRALAVDADGNIVIVGDFGSPALTLGSQVLTNLGGTDVFVAKITPQGQVLWARNAGYSASHEGNAVAVDAEKNVYIAGKFWGRTRFGTSEFDSHFDYDTFLAKYSPDGELQWARQLGSFSVTVARNLAVDADNNIVMAGYLDQSCDFDEYTLIAHGSQDVFLAKFNPLGKVLWAKNFGGAGTETPRSLAVDGAKNIYVAGSFEGVANFGGIFLATSGQRDAFLVVCDSTGQVLWAKQAGGTRSDDGFALAVSPAGQTFLGGSFQSSAFFDGVTCDANNGSVDAFVAQLGAASLEAGIKLSALLPGNVLQISGPVGKTVVIQATADLSNTGSWQPVGQFILDTSPTTWNDPQPASSNQKFYRAVVQP